LKYKNNRIVYRDTQSPPRRTGSHAPVPIWVHPDVRL